MKLGILGGTFNPPHIGHLRLAEETACVHGLERILFMPCYTPPHKTHGEIAAAHHRLDMTRLACEDNAAFEASDMEIARRETSYTVVTLEILKQRGDCECYFIIGTDSLAEIHTWRECHRLFSLSNFICVQRPSHPFGSAWSRVPEAIRSRFTARGNRLYHTDGDTVLIPSEVMGLDVSSTRIRNLIKESISIRYLVPESVRRYMVQHNLYGKGAA
ncbi:MAG: nicotinate-nucleotide adenylyltransferase [Thermodesulfobacteriota bacterium]